jgi:hypothetical protein
LGDAILSMKTKEVSFVESPAFKNSRTYRCALYANDGSLMHEKQFQDVVASSGVGGGHIVITQEALPPQFIFEDVVASAATSSDMSQSTSATATASAVPVLAPATGAAAAPVTQAAQATPTATVPAAQPQPQTTPPPPPPPQQQEQPQPQQDEIVRNPNPQVMMAEILRNQQQIDQMQHQTLL